MHEVFHLISDLLAFAIVEILHPFQSHLTNQIQMPIPCQRLCQCIGHHVFCWTVNQLNLAHLHTFSDEMILNIDVLRSCMVFWVLCQCDCSLVVLHDPVDVFDH